MGSPVVAGSRPAHTLLVAVLLAFMALTTGAGKASTTTFIVTNQPLLLLGEAGRHPDRVDFGTLTKLEHAQSWFIWVPVSRQDLRAHQLPLG